jgi:hypothetical protein
MAEKKTNWLMWGAIAAGAIHILKPGSELDVIGKVVNAVNKPSVVPPVTPPVNPPLLPPVPPTLARYVRANQYYPEW